MHNCWNQAGFEASAPGPAERTSPFLVPQMRAGVVRHGGSVPPLWEAVAMTLRELAPAYGAAAELLSRRLSRLRRELRSATQQEEIWRLRRRIQELTPMLTQMHELEELTAHYYERGYWRNEKYCL